MAEYVLARLAHGVADGTIRGEITAVEQFLDHAAVFAWEVEPAHADRFLGQAQRHQAPETRRGKAGAIDLFFRFLEARYRGEIHELTGRVVASPIDACNRPRHSGDFHVRVPPSPEALAAFFASWRAELPGGPQVAGRRQPLRDGPAGIGDRAAAAGAVRAAASATARSARSTSGSARARADPAPGSGWCRCWETPGRCWSGGSRTSAASSAMTGSCPGRRCSPPSGAGRSAGRPSPTRSGRPRRSTCAGRSPS